MKPDEVRELEAFLTEEERAELYELIEHDLNEVPWRSLPGPQGMAWNSDADIIGYGGAAGGGKTDLICGLALMRHHRVLIARREKAQTEGVVQRMLELLGDTKGYNSQKGFWWLPNERGTLLELAGLDNPGDERRWQGRPHDLKAFDEATEMRENQVRFVMGWNRSSMAGVPSRVLMTFNPPTTDEGRWVIEFFGPWLNKKHDLYPTPPGEKRYAAMLPDGRGSSKDVWVDHEGKALTGAPFVMKGTEVVYDFDPKAYKPEDIITPKSRTFIPARLTDNPYYMATNYMSTLQSLPEPLRSQMLYGDFQAGISDDPWQTIPTAWVEAAMARWKPRDTKGEMLALGVDVARGGKDNTVLAPRYRHEEAKHSLWFDEPKLFKGSETPDGPSVVGHVVACVRHKAPILIDVIGVGASPYDLLKGMQFQVLGVNVSEKSHATDRSGRLRFKNLRTELWWKMREALDPTADTGIALPPDEQLKKELCAPKWRVQGFEIQVESRDEIIERIGKSPDLASAYILALIDLPKIDVLRVATGREEVMNYDPMESFSSTSYDPMSRM